jgi:hypothetical protein
VHGELSGFSCDDSNYTKRETKVFVNNNMEKKGEMRLLIISCGSSSYSDSFLQDLD